MQVDKWFYEKSKFVQFLLLALPIVGWIVEILIRLSIASREKTAFHYIILLVFVFFGEFWILCIIDLVFCLFNGHLIFSENTADSDTEFYQ